MSDQQKLDGIASALNAGDWAEANRLARELGDACDQRGVLTLRPLEIWPLLSAIASLTHELEEGGFDRVEIDDDDDGDELEDDEEEDDEEEDDGPGGSW